MRKMITCTLQQQLWLMLDIYCQYADGEMPRRLQMHAHRYCVVIRFLCKWKRRVGQIDRKPFCKKRKGCIGATWPVIYLSPTPFRSYAGCKLQVKQVPCTIRLLQASKRFILCWAELEKCPGSLPVPGRFATDSKLRASVGSLRINSHTSTLKIKKREAHLWSISFPVQRCPWKVNTWSADSSQHSDTPLFSWVCCVKFKTQGRLPILREEGERRGLHAWKHTASHDKVTAVGLKCTELQRNNL